MPFARVAPNRPLAKFRPSLLAPVKSLFSILRISDRFDLKDRKLALIRIIRRRWQLAGRLATVEPHAPHDCTVLGIAFQPVVNGFALTKRIERYGFQITGLHKFRKGRGKT